MTSPERVGGIETVSARIARLRAVKDWATTAAMRVLEARDEKKTAANGHGIFEQGDDKIGNL